MAPTLVKQRISHIGIKSFALITIGNLPLSHLKIKYTNLMQNYQHLKYLKMIITGLVYNYDYLGQYLKREQKKAEKEHIDFSEFIGRTITVVEDLEGEFRRLRDLEKNALEAKKDGTNDNIIDEQINNLRVTEGFKLPLDLYTDGEFKGNIGFWDVSKIRDAIREVFEFYSIEKEIEDNEPIEYFQKKRGEFEAVEEKVNTEPNLNPYPEVFKSLKAFLLFQRLYANKKTSKNLLADFSFIYRRMTSDDLLMAHQKPEVFREWLSKEPYEVVLDNKFKTLNYCNTSGKEEGYKSAKLLEQILTD